MYNEAYYAAGDKLEAVFHRAGVLRPDQLACFHYAHKFGTPKNLRVYSIGCGAGLLEDALYKSGMYVVGIDPSEYALNRWRFKKNNGGTYFEFVNSDLRKFIDDYPIRFYKATTIFCQSLEHIPAQDIIKAMPVLAGYNHLIIITNTVNWHPIMPNNDDHITLVDDELFNWIASFGETLFRYKSHLVVQT